jgi:hypothetical protein
MWKPFTLTQSAAVSPSEGHNLPKACQFPTATGSLVFHVDMASPMTSSKMLREPGTNSSGTISELSSIKYYLKIDFFAITYD